MPEDRPSRALSGIKIIIFDMDGVLVDVTDSYRRTVAQTIETYLTRVLGFRKAHRPLVEEGDIVFFKQIGGFNNDWDLTTGLLLYFLSLLDLQPPETSLVPQTLDEALHILKAASRGRPVSVDALLRGKNLEEFSQRVRRCGTGLETVRGLVGPKSQALIFSEGELDKTNLIRRIFQEIYLGPNFLKIHHLSPRFYRGRGMYRRERLLIGKETLEALSKRISLGIASGRPRAEADLALRRFGIGPYFTSIITLDDCEEKEAGGLQSRGERGSLTKPHPFSIIEAVRRISTSAVRSAYVGDVLDDMEAANRAKRSIDILAIGCLATYKNDRREMRELFMTHGADLVVESPDELPQLLMSRRSRDPKSKPESGRLKTRGG